VQQGSQAKTIQHIRDIFGRMGFNDKEAVALCGAHAVGRCHTDRSGWVLRPSARQTALLKYLKYQLRQSGRPHLGVPHGPIRVLRPSARQTALLN
jgi:hypothetical protein